MNETRDFDLADVLSITTELLLSHRHMDGVYDLLSFMTGGELWTHQLPRAAQAMAPILIEQHPWLAEITAPDTTKAELFEWLTRVEAEHPGLVTVTAAPDRYRSQGPLSELADRLGADRVIIPVIM